MEVEGDVIYDAFLTCTDIHFFDRKMACRRRVTDILQTFHDMSQDILLTCRDKDTCFHVSSTFLRTKIYSTEATEFPHIGKLIKVQTIRSPPQTLSSEKVCSVR